MTKAEQGILLRRLWKAMTKANTTTRDKRSPFMGERLRPVEEERVALDVLKVLEAGIRYGWASRGLFEIRPLKQKAVDKTIGQVVDAYSKSGGFPRFGLTTEVTDG